MERSNGSWKFLKSILKMTWAISGINGSSSAFHWANKTLVCVYWHLIVDKKVISRTTQTTTGTMSSFHKTFSCDAVLPPLQDISMCHVTIKWTLLNQNNDQSSSTYSFPRVAKLIHLVGWGFPGSEESRTVFSHITIEDMWRWEREWLVQDHLYTWTGR